MCRNKPKWQEAFLAGNVRGLARAISAAENSPAEAHTLLAEVRDRLGRAHVIGITGPPGAGKSTLTGRIASELLGRGLSLGLLLVDPSSPFSGGAILGDRLRLPDITSHDRVYARSMSSRGSMGGLSSATGDAVKLLDAFGKDVILVETVGTGQAETDVMKIADTVIVVAVPGLGDDIQAMKAGILEIADLFVVNKADREGADRTERELLAMLKLQASTNKSDWRIPVLKTQAVNDIGIVELVDTLLAHREFLAVSGQAQTRREERLRQELDGLLVTRLLGEVTAHVGLEGLSEAVRSVQSGELSIYQVADQLWEGFKVALVRDFTTKQ